MAAHPRRHPCRLAAVLVAAASLAPAQASAVEASNGLSPQLAALARPASPAGRAAALLGAPNGFARDGQRVLVDARFERGVLAGLPGLRAAGGEVVAASGRYQTATVAVKPTDLPELARVANVASVAPVRPPIVASVSSGGVTSASPTTPCFGAETSEGDLQLNAMAAREGFEVDGSGIEVGILSDSFRRDPGASTTAALDVATGDLPGPGNPCGHLTPAQVVDEGPSGHDEGRAMAQIVHDLAPGATLAFATAFSSEIAFAEHIGALAEGGAQVIVDDVFYPEEPFFQDGPVAVAANEAVEAGATYLSAAGNDNLIDSAGRDIASWEAPEFRDSGECPEPLVLLSEAVEEAKGPGTGLNPSHCMDFDPTAEGDDTFGITVSRGATLTLDLQWAEPRGGVASDLDAYLFRGEELLESSIEDNASPGSEGGTQEPVEVVEWKNDTGAAAQVQLVVNRFSGSESTPLKFALLENGSGVTATEYPESSEGDVVGPTIFGHAGSASVVGVGAVPYFDAGAPERYSSRGPVTHYFGPVTGAVPAEPLASPEVVTKPDVVATDGGANTFFGSCVSHVWRFFGTSAAAPHAAAVAALGLEAVPTALPAEVADALKSTTPIVGFPPEAVGAGLVNAPEAIATLSGAPFPGGAQSPAPRPENCGLPSGTPVPSSTSPSPSPAPPSPAALPAPARHRLPRTFFLRRPQRVVRTHHAQARVVFRFGSNVPGVTFVCRVDSGLFRPCGARFVRRFPVGRHSVKVSAREPGGSGDRTPAVYRFRVKQVS